MKMVDTVVAVMETVKSPISLSSTMETMQQQRQQEQQQKDSSVKSLDLQCDEEFDEILAERPSTSYNHLHHHHHQQQQQQQQQHNSTNNHISISNGETIDNCAIVDSPLFNKMKRQWRNYGWYKSCEEMDEVRRREKVSKRKSVTSVHGTKVFYRCNNWRRTRCNFRMYAIIFTSDKMCLFASGEHDHTAKDPYYVTDVIPQAEKNFEITPQSTTQQDILTQFVLNATANLPFGANSESTSQQLLSYQPPTYQLADEQRITGMLQLAMEIDHKFTFIQRNNEFCFEPNNPALKGRSVVLLDGGTVVLVIERFNGMELSREIWQKAYWNQFLWAVRGKCMRVLYQNFKEPACL
ncbi:unnamed protein product [Brugia pahangi]|uniref:FLYWCH-type domain-containing protein n=1 Tax=Brugia pahangi TaxID=6280 RepID=A0A0N4TSF8_BRUPA|nr:unnamed protein product [Brugia pahangi]